MNTIDFYIDNAKTIYRVDSDRKLSIALGLNPSSVSTWRVGRSYPNDDTMVKLAKMAGVSEAQALLELSYWRSEGETKKVYHSIWEKVAKTAVKSVTLFACSTAILTAISIGIATAKDLPPASTKVLHNHSNNLYYGKSDVTLKKAVKRLFTGFVGFLKKKSVTFLQNLNPMVA